MDQNKTTRKGRREGKRQSIPYSTIVRLTQYLRILDRLNSIGITMVSSNDLCEESRVNSFLVRKDLSYFGEFGTRGVGYNIAYLREEIAKILGLDVKRKLVIVGAGNLGTALAKYRGFRERGFELVGIFDSDPTKIGMRIDNLQVESIFKFDDFVRVHNGIDIGIIAVPAFSAQYVANTLLANNVKAVLNFAPIPIEVSENVIYQSVDLTTHLEILSFYLQDSNRKG